MLQLFVKFRFDLYACCCNNWIAMKGNQITLLVISLRIIYGLPTEPLKTFVHVRQGQNITVPCSSFGKALTLEEGRFSFLRWYVLTYDGVKPQWTFLAGMNEDGNRSVDGDWYKAFNITRDGGLYIHEAQPCHLQEFRCTVVLRSGRSPLTNYVTLKLEKPPTEKPEQTEAGTSSGSKNPRKVETTDPLLGFLIGTITIAVISVIGNFVMAFLLYQVRSHLSIVVCCC